jgi:prepilin-type N-terminal cleavage/methylation domain-containing protein
VPHSRSRTGRSAFTLVELLVVISIIGVLMALLLPAVNAARMAALRATCQARLGQLAQGTQNYETGKKKFPSSVTWAENGPALTNSLPWAVRILPFIDQQKLYDQIVNRDPTMASAQYVETLVCAADADAGDGPVLSYVANVGRPDELGSPIASSVGTLPRNLKANGIFHDARAFPQHDVNMLYVTRGDGASNTLLYTENRNATTWTDLNEYNLGFVWAVDAAELGGTPMDVINSPDTGSTGYAYARPSANHSDIFNNVFADGSVRPLSQEIDMTVFARIMTPRGGDTLPAAVAALQSVPVTAGDLTP